MTSIGLFGGTFNPIHLGHLRSAEEIGGLFELDRVIFIPSSHPPHKEKEGMIAAPLRLKMVRLAIADNPRFSLSPVELERPGKSYSLETIEHFRRQFGRESHLFFILGLDAFLEINTWREYRALFGLCHFVVMTRPGFEKNFSFEHLPVELAADFCYDTQEEGYVHVSGRRVYPREITALDISSTRIRRDLQNGRSVKYLLPAPVEDYIKRLHLYRTKEVESTD
jgi:nicotinate-nucleotide adenylyltransferase